MAMLGHSNGCPYHHGHDCLCGLDELQKDLSLVKVMRNDLIKKEVYTMTVGKKTVTFRIVRIED